MIILLDENFPLALYTRLQKEGFHPTNVQMYFRFYAEDEIGDVVTSFAVQRAA